ncbi:UDP-N-acetylmuramate dehydrogenase [Mangrovimonas cancribranchiae]|uniref:UDP-N-acetylenolpyruvoylglucosamine reductase n=1 Tax=Mangrovimonas cancribranchiae TaxID=3080055 RepID=A0AAU6P9M4_9FLAO
MTVRENISLKPYNTFGIDVKAKKFIEINTVNDLKLALNKFQKEKLFILGGGSNMLLTKDIDALVLHINIKGIEVISENDTHVTIQAHAGENWHEFVLWCLKNNFGGIENLSLIPGNVGTAPIQNIGAYGVELKDVFVSCNAIEIATQNIVTFSKSDCNFGYRESVFKQNAKGKYIITSVCFSLTKSKHNLHTGYGAITAQLEKMDVKKPTISHVSKAVIAIRESKLPNPKEIGNSGSFFKNPIITKPHFNILQNNFPNVPFYKISKNEIKIPAGWLIEQSGFKGKTFGNYGVHKKQALVLVNYNNANGKDILHLARLIQKTVKRIFNIDIETEVNII